MIDIARTFPVARLHDRPTNWHQVRERQPESLFTFAVEGEWKDVGFSLLSQQVAWQRTTSRWLGIVPDR